MTCFGQKGLRSAWPSGGEPLCTSCGRPQQPQQQQLQQQQQQQGEVAASAWKAMGTATEEVAGQGQPLLRPQQQQQQQQRAVLSKKQQHCCSERTTLAWWQARCSSSMDVWQWQRRP